VSQREPACLQPSLNVRPVPFQNKFRGLPSLHRQITTTERGAEGGGRGAKAGGEGKGEKKEAEETVSH